MEKNFEANAHSIFAGSYERFLFGHSYGPNFSTSFTAAGEEEFEKKSNNTKLLCTIDAHSQSIKSITAAVRVLDPVLSSMKISAPGCF